MIAFLILGTVYIKVWDWEIMGVVVTSYSPNVWKKKGKSSKDSGWGCFEEDLGY